MTLQDGTQTGSSDENEGKRSFGRVRGRGAWSYRYLIWNFMRRDIKARYNATALGWAWSMMVPLLMVGVYSLVFGEFFGSQAPPASNGGQVFALWFFVGLIAFSIFRASITSGMGDLLGSGSLMQQVYIPGYVPVLGSLAGVIYQACIELGLAMLLLLVIPPGLNIGWTWLLLPVWLLLFSLFVTPIAYAFAILNAYLRDTEQIIGVLLQLLFFMSGIMYTLDKVPEKLFGLPLRQILELNPVYEFVEAAREIMYSLTVPALSHILYLIAWTAAMSGLAWLVHQRWGRNVGEVL